MACVRARVGGGRVDAVRLHPAAKPAPGCLREPGRGAGPRGRGKKCRRRRPGARVEPIRDAGSRASRIRAASSCGGGAGGGGGGGAKHPGRDRYGWQSAAPPAVEWSTVRLGRAVKLGRFRAAGGAGGAGPCARHLGPGPGRRGGVRTAGWEGLGWSSGGAGRWV